MSSSSDDRRKAERRKLTGLVYYSEGFETYDPAKHVATYAGEMLDISKRGACIITNHFFQQGSKIKLTFRDMGDFSTIAMVRWCREGDDGTYQVGLQMPKDVD